MKLTTNNLLVSLTVALAGHLRAKGYDIYWQAADTTDAQTVLPEKKGTVTFVPAFPANPTFIVRLRSESAGTEEIVVPAISLMVGKSPHRVRSRGLGHKDYEWERKFSVFALAADEFQHRELADLLHDWLESESFKAIPMADYDADAATPPPLEPVYVVMSSTDPREVYADNDATRYRITTTAVVTYIE
jgi:hypothetical protein